MLHVILTILKILGIIILILLALILLILVLVLFVPVRCRVSGSYIKDKTKPYVKVDMSWLLHLVLYRLIYQGGIKENNLKILGIKVYPGDNNGKSYKKDKKKKSKTDSNVKTDENEESASEEEKLPAQDVSINIDDKTDTANQAAAEAVSDTKVSDERSIFEKIKDIIDNILNKIRLFFESFTDKIKSKYNKVKEKATGFIKKVTDVRSFVQDAENIEALKDVLIGVKNLLIHMRPRKVKINGELGFEDPSVTGRIFGILGILNSYYNGCINIKANFEEPVIDIEFDIKGRVTVAYAVLILLRFMKNKRIRKWVFRK